MKIAIIGTGNMERMLGLLRADQGHQPFAGVFLSGSRRNRVNLFLMTLQEFRHSLLSEEPPGQLSFALAGLWWDARNNWKQAHESAQQDEGPAGSWFMPTCTAKREILPMRVTGTGGPTSLQPRVRLSKSGSRSPSHC
jgi:hypothetical protein